MESFYVIGCISLQLSADGIKVFREGGVMSIAWSDVKFASLGGINDYSQRMQWMSMVMGGQLGGVRDMIRIARQSQATILHKGSGTTPQKYDLLWIAHRGGTLLVYIEPGGPERDQLLTGLRTGLGPLWLGEGVGSGMAPPRALEYVDAEPAGRTLEEPVDRVDEKKSGCPLMLGCVATIVFVLFYGSLFFRLFRLFSGGRGEIQPTAVEVDRIDEVLFVAEAPGRVLHPLDLGVDRLAGRIGDPVLQVGDDVLEAPFEHAGHFDHGGQTAAHRPLVPPLEVLPRRAFVDVGVQAHRGLLHGPGSRRLQVTVA